MSAKIDQIQLFHSNDLYTAKRIITLTGEIDQNQYEKVIKNLKVLDSTEGAIDLIINSEGGDLEMGFAIYDAIKACKNPVIATVYGAASSAASLILQAADERIMSANAYLMIHLGYELTEGNPLDKKIWDAHHKVFGDRMVNVYYERVLEKDPKYKKEKFEKMISRDTILYTENAIQLGLADRVEE